MLKPENGDLLFITIQILLQVLSVILIIFAKSYNKDQANTWQLLNIFIHLWNTRQTFSLSYCLDPQVTLVMDNSDKSWHCSIPTKTLLNFFFQIYYLNKRTCRLPPIFSFHAQALERQPLTHAPFPHSMKASRKKAAESKPLSGVSHRLKKKLPRNDSDSERGCQQSSHSLLQFATVLPINCCAPEGVWKEG